MNRHTPKPWIVKEGEGAVFDILTPQGVEITFVSRTNPLNAEANARLISAAPELLEACKSLMSLVESFTPFQKKHPSVEVAKHTVAKAEGVTL